MTSKWTRRAIGKSWAGLSVECITHATTSASRVGNLKRHKKSKQLKAPGRHMHEKNEEQECVMHTQIEVWGAGQRGNVIYTWSCYRERSQHLEKGRNLDCVASIELSQ